MACGLASLSVIEDEGLVERSAEIGALLMERLRGLQTKHPFIKEVRGKGLMIAIEFHEPPQLRGKIAWRLMHKIDQSLFTQIVVVPLLSQHRVLTQVAGHHMDVIKILPPLIITEKEVDRFVNALDQTLDECQRFPGPMLELARNYARTALRGADKPGNRRVSKPAANSRNGKNGKNGHHGHNGHNGHPTNGNGNGKGRNIHTVSSNGITH